MIIDYSNYNGDVWYDDTLTRQQEAEIIKYMNEFSSSDYDKILNNDFNTHIVSNLSKNTRNIIKWYEFSNNCRVLEIGAKFGNITEELCSKGCSVTSVELSKSRVEAIEKRLNKYDKLKVICSTLNVDIQEKFDYVILNDVFYYADKLIKADNNIDAVEKLLQFSKEHLNLNGKLIIITDNKFGAKFIIGDDKFKSNKNFDTSIENNIFGKKEIVEFLERINSKNIKFYYPLPDYKLTRVIYSDEYIPHINDSKFIYSRYYNEDTRFYYNELEFIKGATKSKYFDIFANSYFIEVSFDDKIYEKSKEVREPKFINYNISRKDEYKLITKIYNDVVEKLPEFECSKKHINEMKSIIDKLKADKINILDCFDNGKIVSKFIDSITLDKHLINIYKNYGKERFYLEILNVFEFFKNKIYNQKLDIKFEDSIFKKFDVIIDKELYQNLSMVKNGYIDLVFENMFLLDNEYIVFDQEWYFENVPFEYIMYRALYNMYIYNKSILEDITFDEILEQFKLLEYKEVFFNLEQNFQNFVLNNDTLKYFAKADSNTFNKEYTLELEQNVRELNKYCENYRADINNLKVEKNEIEDKVVNLEKKCQELSEKIDNLNNSNNSLNNELNYFKNKKIIINLFKKH